MPTEAQTSLQKQRKQLTVDALIAAAQRGMKQRGLEVTVDHVAALAGASRRTVFRHFETREALLETALAATMADFARSLPEYTSGDWVAWLEEVAKLAHEASAEWSWLVWDLYGPRVTSRLAPYADASTRRWAETASKLWKAAGGDGAAPLQLEAVVVAHMGPLFTQAVLVHAGGTPELAAKLATEAIVSTLRESLSGRSAARGPR